MVRTNDRAAQEPPSVVNRRQHHFSAPPFGTIDSDKSPPSPLLQPRRPRRNCSPTPIVVVYPPHEPPNSADHPPNSPVEPPNSSDSQDRLSPRPNVHTHQPTQPGPSRRISRPPNDGAKPHSTERRTRGRQQLPLAGSSTPSADDTEYCENETENQDTEYHPRE
ncbi:hypothetical protein ES332_D08G229200v1 [Gossypium tomentosum]|uniref:Uncharacterized protein n=1 Tax=Gossypium tomentosum TaxID=34277 RepID=A0A5D2JYK4_GOSTO|nr:hypothetical protein ES332_D08G229200v1 [Gossypium tomentosum]